MAADFFIVMAGLSLLVLSFAALVKAYGPDAWKDKK